MNQPLMRQPLPPAPAVTRIAIAGKAPAFPCPCCDSKSHARSSVKMSSLSRMIFYRCLNELCGHHWTATLEYMHTTVPSNFGAGKIPLPRLKIKGASQAPSQDTVSEG